MTAFLSLLATASLAFAAGWALACVALAQSHMNTARDFDRERQELDDEREALNTAWLSVAKAPPEKVKFDIQGHREISRILQ